MNKYPLWKYLLVLIVVVGSILTLAQGRYSAAVWVDSSNSRTSRVTPLRAAASITRSIAGSLG